jgi:succinate dehydrogenase / fumarate reductase cytochrome b subunit
MQSTKDSAKKCHCDSRLINFLESSIGKKIMVALAGLLLCGFLVMHLAGNLFLFAGDKAFNHYAEMLESNPLLPVAEVGLFVLFLIHIVLSLRARLANRAARPIGYQFTSDKGARTPGSRTMAVSGSLILFFLIVHIRTFRFAPEYLRESNLYGVVVGWFQNPLYASFYVLALIALGLHLSHGFQSALQTLGLNHPRYTPTLRKIGLALAALVTLGFISMPIYFGFLGGAK